MGYNLTDWSSTICFRAVIDGDSACISVKYNSVLGASIMQEWTPFIGKSYV